MLLSSSLLIKITYNMLKLHGMERNLRFLILKVTLLVYSKLTFCINKKFIGRYQTESAHTYRSHLALDIDYKFCK